MKIPSTKRSLLSIQKLSIQKLIILTSTLVLLANCDNSKSDSSETDMKASSEKMATKTTDAKVEMPVFSKKYKASNVPENMTVQEKKDRFRALLVPPTLKVYAELNKQHKEVAAWIKKGEKPKKIAALKVEYKAETDQQLLAALKPHPPSIALAQAALESAWATSRFFVKANNVFGVWSFDKNEPRIAAGEQRGDKTIWLKKYKNVEASVRDNYRVLARSHAFQEFRDLRVTSDNPYELVKKLDKYSEKGHEYGEELSSMMSFNKLTAYDPVVHQKP